MRVFTRTYGSYPKLRTTTVMAWTPDLTRADGDGGGVTALHRWIGAAPTPMNTLVGTPKVMNSPCGVGRRFLGGSANQIRQAAPSGDSLQMLGSLSWQCWMYIVDDQPPGGAGSDYHFAWLHAEGSSDGLAENCLVSVAVKADHSTGAGDRVQSLSTFWEYGSGDNVFCDSSQPPPLNQWIHVAMVRDDDPNNAGKQRLKMYINGCQTRLASGELEVFDNLTPPAGGTDGRWAMGDFPNAGGTYPFNGSVGIIVVDQGAYTEEEIVEDYRRGCGTATENRVHGQAWVRDTINDSTPGNSFQFFDLSRFIHPSSPLLSNPAGFIFGADGDKLYGMEDTVDILQAFRIDDSVDNRVATATVNILKDYGKVNTSPFMSESFLNRRTSPLGDSSTFATRSAPTAQDTVYFSPTSTTPTSFFSLGQAMYLKFARMPYGRLPYRTTWDLPSDSVDDNFGDLAMVDFEPYFWGYVDAIDVGEDILKIKMRDAGMLMADMFIESDDQTAVGRFVGVGETLYTAINNVVLNAANWSSTFFGYSTPPTVYEPVGSDWAFGVEGTVDRDGLLAAANKLASQIGWILRFKWTKHYGNRPTYPGSTSYIPGKIFAPTLFDPERNKKICDTYISTSDYTSIKSLSINLSGVRNKVRVYYWIPGWGADMNYGVANINSITMAPDRVETTAEDLTSQDKYGVRFMEVQESKSSLINSVSEGDRMAGAIRDDLAEPLAKSSAQIMDMVEVELNDMIMFEPNGVQFDVPMYFAATTLSVDFKDGMATVSAGIRERPSSGSSRHLASARTGNSGAMFRSSLRDGRRPTMDAIANAIDPLHAITQGGGLANCLSNQGFNFNTAGSSQPPIGWSASSGTWGDPAGATPGDMWLLGPYTGNGSATGSLQGQTGGFVLDFFNTTGVFESDWYPVTSGRAYTLTVRHGSENLTSQLKVEIFYDTKVGGGGATDSDVITSTLQVPAGGIVNRIYESNFNFEVPYASYTDGAVVGLKLCQARVAVSVTGMGGGSHVYVDSIRLAPAEPTIRLRPAANIALAKTPYVPQQLVCASTVFGVGISGGGLGYIRIKEEGYYDINFAVYFYFESSMANPNFTDAGVNAESGRNGMYGGVWFDYAFPSAPYDPPNVAGSKGTMVFSSEAGGVYYYHGSSTGSARVYLEQNTILRLGYWGMLDHDDNVNFINIITNATGGSFLEASKVRLESG